MPIWGAEDLLTLSQLTFRKPARTLVVLAGALVYALVCIGLAEVSNGFEFEPALYSLLAFWGLGLAAFMALDKRDGRFDTGTLTFAKSCWANVGVVASALFVPEELRLLLLVVPLLGILHAALHLAKRQVAHLTLITWFAYLLVQPLLHRGANPLAGTELPLTLGFTAMLAMMFFMAGEVTALRLAFQRRNSRLNAALEQLADLAMRDDLTGLYNRRYVMEVLNRQKALADRGHVGFTLCYCDLDHFKRINDRLGHPQGDRVLQAFARSAEQAVRSVDFVARFGGEEFLLVLVDADKAAAQRVAERLCASVRDLKVTADELDQRLTVSVGIAEFRAGETVEDVIQRADRALYRAKSSGRDRIVQG